MIYYNSRLMPNEGSAILFMVSNPVPFENYEDHEAAIYVQLHTLVEEAIAVGDNPILLIEDYLGITYTDGTSVAEIATFLANTDKIQNALWVLKEHWTSMDSLFPANSQRYGGMSKESAIRLYSETTLRSYLETLAQYQNE